MMVLSVLGEQKVRRITFGGVERLVKVLTGFSEATEMAAGSGSGYIGIFCSGWNYHQWAWEVDSKLDYQNPLERGC